MSNKKNKNNNIFGDITLPTFDDPHWHLNADDSNELIYHDEMNISIEGHGAIIRVIFIDNFEFSRSEQAYAFSEEIIRHHQKKHIETNGEHRATAQKKPGTILRLVPNNPEPDPELPRAA